MILDYPSIVFFLILNNIFIIALLSYNYFNHHKQWYLLLFTLGIAFQTTAMIVFANKDFLPHLYVVRINNFLIITSFALQSFGLLSFDGKIRKKLLKVLIVFVLVLYASILLVEENYTIVSFIRIISGSIFFGICTFYLFTNKNKYKFSILLSVVLFIFSVFQFYRAFHIYVEGEYDILTNTPVSNWFFIITLFVFSSTSIGFIMLLKEKDEKTIRLKNKIIQKDKKKFEALTQTQNKLFSIIGHDLRSPVNNIVGLSKLLTKNIKKGDYSESEKYLEFINSSSNNTLTLLDDLLNWAKCQNGDLLIKLENIDLSEVILEIIESQKIILKVKNISLNYSPSTAFTVYADKNMILTIFRNIISNAIKFTKTGGTIKILTDRKQHHIQVTVSDNGIGMDNETMSKLFNIEPNESTLGTDNEKGSGFGLTLCKEFLDKLGGEIWVESEKGIGSDFIFTLPLGKE